MSDYGYGDGTEDNDTAAADDRLTLMQQYIDMDLARKKMQKEAHWLSQRLDALEIDQRKVRERLGNLLGFKALAADANDPILAGLEEIRTRR